MGIEHAAVVGLGTMGAGIAETFARAGVAVRCVEVNADLLAAGRSRIENSLQRAVDRGHLAGDEQQGILGRLSFGIDRSQLTDSDLVIEAVPERLDMKTELFADLDQVCPATTIFATNTSSLPVTAIAAESGRPDRVVGMHFFNPAPVMRLVEVVAPVQAGPDVVGAVRELAVRCGKSPVVVTDRAGFVANTLLFGYLGHAARLVDTGVVAVADIDAAMTAGCGLPMGPMQLMDLVGLDVSVEILRVLADEFGPSRYVVAPSLLRLVMAGRLGRKTGEGWYRYEGREATPATGRAVVEAVQPQGTPKMAVVGAVAQADAVVDALGGPQLVPVESADLLLAALGAHASDLRHVVAEHPGVPVVGVHLPRAPRPTPVVEFVVTDAAPIAPDAMAAVRAVAADAGRTPVTCRARPGYVLEALLFGQLDDAARMAGDGYASPTDIDTAMRLGCGYPAGPFALIDAVGAKAVADGSAAATGSLPAAYLLDLAAGLER